jgi:hypothetical protein
MQRRAFFQTVLVPEWCVMCEEPAEQGEIVAWMLELLDAHFEYRHADAVRALGELSTRGIKVSFLPPRKFQSVSRGPHDPK